MNAEKSILVVDNFDSFTFNLVHALEAITGRIVVVKRNDEVAAAELDQYEKVIFSPGPGLPQESPALMNLVAAAVNMEIPILGVCLGHQALAVHKGGRLKNLNQVHHGVSHNLNITDMDCPIFSGLEMSGMNGSVHIDAARYHSWVVDEITLGPEWRVTCRDHEGEVMAMRHRSLPFYGIQFHPESILTPKGRLLLGNFLSCTSVSV